MRNRLQSGIVCRRLNETPRPRRKRPIANSAARPNMVEYVLVTISKNEAGREDVSIPHPDVFVELTGAANYQLILENPNWGLVTDSCEPDAVGVGFISLNYQYRTGAERYKKIIQSYSTEEMKVQLYPTTKHLNRCALSIYLHAQHFVPTERLASVIALCNQDTLRGEFTICLLYTSPSPRDS